MTSTLIVIVGCYLLICILAFAMQRQLIYHPFRTIVAAPDQFGMKYREFMLRSPDGVEFRIWEISADSSRTYVVHFHGNAENISSCLDTYKTLHEMGVNIYAVEYRGYGKSTGTPSENGINSDVATMANYLREALHGKAAVVVGMGRSLGGAVAVKFAGVYPVKGVILESTFNCMTDVAAKAFPLLPVSVLLREKYDSQTIIKTLDCAALVFHSREDEVVPYELGQRLYDAIPGEKEFVEIFGSHNSAYHASDVIVRGAYREFFDRLRGTATQ